MLLVCFNSRLFVKDECKHRQQFSLIKLLNLVVDDTLKIKANIYKKIILYKFFLIDNNINLDGYFHCQSNN